MPFGCANPAHGCGYRDDEGSVRVTYPIFAVRRMFQQLQAIVAARGGLITVHQSSCCMTPILGYCNSYWDGEHIFGTFDQDKGLEAVLATFRAEFMGKNFGIPCEFLGKPPVLAYTLLHDVRIRPGMSDSLDKLAPIWQVMSAFGVSEAEWHPYWRNRTRVTTDAPSFRVSAYVKPGEALLVVSNLSPSAPVDAHVKFAAIHQAVDALTAERLPHTHGQFTLSLPALQMRLVLLKLRQKTSVTP